MTNTTKPGNADIKARLLSYRQIDCNGVDVAVPREVIHGAFDLIEQLERALAKASNQIAAFESMLEGCSSQHWTGYQNGHGDDVGDRIESARTAYYELQPKSMKGTK